MGSAMSTSFAPECNEAKAHYDNCFNEWYTQKFLKGKSLQNECTEFWDSYKTCVDNALVKQKIKPMLDNARKKQPFTSEEFSRDSGLNKSNEDE